MHRRRVAQRVLVVAIVTLVAGIGFAVTQRNLDKAKGRIEERFQTRGRLAARFTATYAKQLHRLEQAQASKYWGDRVPSDAEFQQLADAFGFQGAVLLDREGRLLRVMPPRPEILGQVMTDRYPHLATALRGQVAVSDVVPSAALNQPVVAFAVPLPTGQQAAVFSGAFDVRSTPLAAFLNDASPIAGAANFLVDGAGVVAATNSGDVDEGTPLGGALAELARLSRTEPSGTYDAHGEPHYFVASTVPGTAWRVILAAPAASLYDPVNSTRRGAFGLALALAIAAAATGWLFLRNTAAREELEAVTRTDLVTGLPNRRHVEEVLAMAAAGAARRDQHVGVLMADIDHFKSINDTYGHRGGDAVLQAVGTRLAAGVRRDEFVGRWGGEEFLVVLPSTDAEAAHRAAERLRQLVGDTVTLVGGKEVRCTLSIGCAVGSGDTDALVHAADEALYEAKRAGRDRVAMASDLSV